MHQKYKIFINGKLLFLVRNPADVEEVLSTDHQFIIQPWKNEKNVARLLQILLDGINASSMIIYGPKPEEILASVTRQFRYIEAAGGVVHNPEGEVLLIYRRGFWDLPKGKLEEGETIEAAAVREVEEETGLRQVKLREQIVFPGLDNAATYHTYTEKGEWVLKASYWFRMEVSGAQKLRPQLEEDIEEAVWVGPDGVPAYMSGMYGSIADVLAADLGVDRPVAGENND